MSSLRRLMLRLYHAIRPGAGESGLDRELRSHLALLEDDGVRRGLTPEAARLAARRAFGGVSQAKDLHREARSIRWLDDLRRDVRYAARTLRRAPGFTTVVVLTLALGLGANSALFAAVNGLLLRPLQVPHPESLVRLRWSGQNDMVTSRNEYGSGKNPAGQDVVATFSYAMYQALRAANHTLTDLVACAPQGSQNVVVDGHAEAVSVLVVSGNYFDGLDVPAVAGRPIGPDDDQPAAAPVAVMSYGYWARRFAQSASVIGKVVTLNNVPVTIIGVTPMDFTGVQSLTASTPDLTLPLVWASQTAVAPNLSPLSEPTRWWLQIVGRLRPGVEPAQVQGNFEGTFQQVAQAGWASRLASLTPQARALSANRNHTAVPHLEVDSARRGIYDVDGNTTHLIALLGGVVWLVLLIVCANVANLLLSRAAARHQEVAVRLSIGATRARLVRQLLTESLLLAALGGLAGALVGDWTLRALSVGDRAPVDWHVVTFTSGLTLLAGIACGLAPAVRATRSDAATAMKTSQRGVAGARTPLTTALLVVQVALSLALLVGAGLFVRTLWNLRDVDLGFDAVHLALFSLNPNASGYNADRTSMLYTNVEQAVEAVPGVRSVSWSTAALLGGSTSTGRFFVAGRPPEGPSGSRIWVMTASPEFFATTGIPLLRGRPFDTRDTEPKAPKVAIINETAARQFFPGEDPVGHRYGESPEQTEDVEIIGVIRDTKYASVRTAPPPTVYSPFLQGTSRGATFEVRTTGDPAAVLPAVRDAIRRLDPTLPLLRVTTQAAQVEGLFEQEHLLATWYGLFGLLALVLASIGLFGVMSYNVARRTTEIGIRVALGAQRVQVTRMVLGESLLIVTIGVALGVGIALAGGRLVAAQLFGLTPTDPLTVLVAILTMVGVSSLAAYVPARRAARVDPIVALRQD